MTYSFPALCCATLLLAVSGGCDAGPADTGEAPYDGPEIEIAVAALELPNVSDAEYRLTVHNDDGQEVWQREVTSGDFGDGAGAIAYVGPCDADSSPNTVALELIDLYEGSAPLAGTTYVNPAPLGEPLVLPFDCEENEDVFVEFNLTILRSAKEGFFDIAVNFNDVFCSAKFDCRDDDNLPIELLPNPFNAYAREMTTILAFACTGDPSGEGSTALYLDDIQITCEGPTAAPGDDQIWSINPSGGPGNLDANSITPDPAADTYIYGVSVYRGEEEIADKLFWNLAIGLEPDAFAAAGDCVLSTRATAADEDLGHVTPTLTTYPYIEWNVTLSDATGLACGKHALDGTDDMVTTRYTGIDTTITFDNELQFIDLGFAPTFPGPPNNIKQRFEGTVGGVDATDVYRIDTQGGPDSVWYYVTFERFSGSGDVELAIYTTEPGDDEVPVAILDANTVEIPFADIAPAVEHPQTLWIVAESTGGEVNYGFDVWLCRTETGCRPN